MTKHMNRTQFTEVIRASKQKTWDVLFNQYGDIHIHNPTMISSNYLHGALHGGLNVVRHCKFSEKLFLDEKITEVDGHHRFKIVVVDHNLPFIKEMAATYELTAIGDEETELRMTSYNSFSPRFMMYLMKGQLAGSLLKHLFGLKYFVETGKAVDKNRYSEVRKNYR